MCLHRLHHNVIKTGVRMISLSYSRISLVDVADKLQLDSAEEAEFIVAKVTSECHYISISCLAVQTVSDWLFVQTHVSACLCLYLCFCCSCYTSWLGHQGWCN